MSNTIKRSHKPSQELETTIEHIPEHLQCSAVTIHQIQDQFTGQIVGYRAILNNGLTRDYLSYELALAWARFMLDSVPKLQH